MVFRNLPQVNSFKSNWFKGDELRLFFYFIIHFLPIEKGLYNDKTG